MYFEWLLKSGGDYHDHERLFKAFGYSVSGPIHRAIPEELNRFSHSSDPMKEHIYGDGAVLNSSSWEEGELSPST